MMTKNDEVTPELMSNAETKKEVLEVSSNINNRRKPVKSSDLTQPICSIESNAICPTG